MAGQTDRDFEVAWKALATVEDDGEWSLIAIRQPRQFSTYAARYRLDNLEALVLGFPASTPIPTALTPEGGGFTVRVAEIGIEQPQPAIALVRTAAGPLDIFGTMVADLLNVIDAGGGVSPSVLASRLVARIMAWQSFMAPPTGGPLSVEAQTGLFGELLFLRELLVTGVPVPSAIAAWEGPLHGAQDFRLGPGAVEVKSSLASEGFVAKIQSLEQLDDSDRAPVFLLALRLQEDDASPSLPELVRSVRSELSKQGSTHAFDVRLSAAGYHADHEPIYARRLRPGQRRIFKVGTDFPRLFSGNIASRIRRANYDIEIDDMGEAIVNDETMFSGLGLR